jgi:hypothetical protein
MSLFNSRTFTARRPDAPGSWVKGRWVVSGSETPLTVTGTFQPETGDRFKTLLEGRRVTSMGLLITDSELFIEDAKAGTNGDIVVVDGLDYLVLGKENWDNGILPHFEYLLIREKEIRA